ncbi:MAG: methionyl-tRNA formyltransferase [Candidatus Paceibacterota bacterium]
MESKKEKIIFLGTPEISVKILESLLKESYEIVLVITSPDKPVGRKQIMTPPPVKTFAEKNNLKVIQPEKQGADVLEEIRKSGALLGIVVAYGHIIPQSIIDSLPKGFLNIHYSLLPEFRGASPVEQSILSGQKETGVTIQKLVFKLDAGPIVAVEKFPLDDQITTPELKEKLTEVGAELLTKILPDYLEGKIEPVEQDESKATHCKKISKADGEIKMSDTDESKWTKYRAYLGWPGIFYFDESGKRNKITEATFENGKFIIKKIIPEGKKEISL